MVMKVIASNLLLLFLLMSGCDTYDSGDLNEDKIETNYWLTYDHNQNSTTAKAEFRFGNDFVELSSLSEITFDQHPLEKSTALGMTWYSVTLDGEVSGVFEYKNDNQDTFANFAAIPPAIEVDSTALFTNQTSYISWKDVPLQEGETVSVTIQGDSSSFRAFTKEVNATSLILRAGELEQKLSGSVMVTLTRSVEPQLEEKTSKGGKIKIEYISIHSSAKVE